MSNSAKKQCVMLHSAKNYAVRLVCGSITVTLLFTLNACTTESTLGGSIPRDRSLDSGQEVNIPGGSERNNDPKHAPITASEGMVLIPAGTFTMGSPESEAERWDGETQHEVTISKNFWMSQYEVTVGEFRRFVTATGYQTEAETSGGDYVLTESGWEEEQVNANWKNPYFSQEDDHPVVLVSWNDAVAYCNWLSRQEGLISAYSISGNDVTWNRSANGYRLPTEAEWEYACRAGTTTPFNTGDNLTTNEANYDGNYPYNGNAEGEYRGQTTATGSFSANAWGLYDMHGNVWEWCWDWFGDYSENNQTDPVGAASGTGRVIRSGGWYDDARGVRSAYRSYFTPGSRLNNGGFRLVRSF